MWISNGRGVSKMWGMFSCRINLYKILIASHTKPINAIEKNKNELREKQLKHIQNFDPTRLKNKSWQIRSGKKTTKKRNKKKKILN